MGNPIMYDNFILDTTHKQGYDQALLDVKNWIERHSKSMKYHKLNNAKGIMMLMNAFIENSEKLREYGDYTEFVLSSDKKKIILNSKNEVDI